MGRPSLSGRLRELRRERGVTARAVGDAVGVSDRQIYRYEWGTSSPTTATVQKLAKYFRTSPAYLMGWS